MLPTITKILSINFDIKILINPMIGFIYESEFFNQNIAHAIE
jgi:hypothetical protein